MTFDAFVSYRRSDFAFAEGIFELCSAFGLNVFLDKRSLRPGRAWEATLLDALQNSRTLLVLWSRSAASSSYMQREWRLVPPTCTVIPVRLDGSPLPDDLAHFQGLEGFGISGRILARSLELTREQKLSRARANQVLLDELAEDGVELEPKQKRALLGFVAVATSGSLLFALGQTRYFARELAGSLLSAKGAAGLLGASLAFGAGSFFAGSGAPTPALSPNVQASLPAPESASTCPALLEECQKNAVEPAATSAAAPPAQRAPRTSSSPAPTGARTATPSLSSAAARSATTRPTTASAPTLAPTAAPATTSPPPPIPPPPATAATMLPSTDATMLPSTAATTPPSTAATTPPSTLQ